MAVGRGTRLVAASTVLLVTVVVLAVLGLGVGSRTIPPDAVVEALLRPGGDAPETLIVRELRIPRTVIAALAGAALGVAGLVMQATTRNPLADPGILGVNAGAAAAVVTAIGFLGVRSAGGTVWFAFAGAAAAALLVHLVGLRRVGERAATTVVLAGVALGACLTAYVGIVALLDTETFESYRFWAVGSLERRELDTALQLGPFIACGLLLAVVIAPVLDQLQLGDDHAASLGAHPVRSRILGGVVITVLCGAATAAAGPISFIGLLVPHVVRRVLGPGVRIALLPTALGGMAVLLGADIVGRLVVRPGELEAGIVTAFVGAPLLFWIASRGRLRLR